jgi:16S rRNA (guanine966-N2)-methyltransferase
MAKSDRKPKSNPSKRGSRDDPNAVVGLRIIGGQLRGRKLQYSGDLRTRPMKDRLREAIFNLVGPSVRNAHAIDLFAGTGALALEALSRGAARATLVEQHYPTAGIIRQNIATLGVEQQAEIVVGNTFIWREKQLGLLPTEKPWVVFCSPPYEFYISRKEEMLELIAGFLAAMPAESMFVVEADARFDPETLPDPTAWDVRTYSPAVVAIYRKE